MSLALLFLRKVKTRASSNTLDRVLENLISEVKGSKCGENHFSRRRRHTRFRTVTGVQTCALPIWPMPLVDPVTSETLPSRGRACWAARGLVWMFMAFPPRGASAHRLPTGAIVAGGARRGERRGGTVF